MIRQLSRFASFAIVLFAGIAGAATPLLIPVDSAKAGAKTSEAAVRFNRTGLEPLLPGAEVELTLPNGSRHDCIFENSIDQGSGFTTCRVFIAGLSLRAGLANHAGSSEGETSCMAG